MKETKRSDLKVTIRTSPVYMDRGKKGRRIEGISCKQIRIDLYGENLCVNLPFLKRGCTLDKSKLNNFISRETKKKLMGFWIHFKKVIAKNFSAYEKFKTNYFSAKTWICTFGTKYRFCADINMKNISASRLHKDLAERLTFLTGQEAHLSMVATLALSLNHKVLETKERLWRHEDK